VAIVVSSGRAETVEQLHAPESKFLRGLRRNVQAHGFLIGSVICFALFTWYPMVR